MTMDAQEAFGQLRSLLHLPQWREDDAERFLEAVDDCATHHPSFYQVQCLPYIEAHPRFQQARFKIMRLKHLNRYATLLPSAAFYFDSRLRNLSGLLDSPALGQIQALFLGDRYKAKDIQRLIDAEPMPNLTSLTLWSDGFGESLQSVLSAPWCQHVTHLEISAQREQWGDLVECLNAHLPHLTSLHFRGCGLYDEDLFAVARTRAFGQLTTLRLEHANLSTESLPAIVQYGHQLKHLDLSYNELCSHGLYRLFEQGWISQLESFWADGCELDEYAFEPEVQLRVSDLSLSNNTLEARGIAHLMGAIDLDRLRTLTLNRTQPGGHGLVALADTLQDAQLQTLHLEGNGIGDDASRLFTRQGCWDHLTHLSLAHSFITAVGAGLLAPLEALPSLRHLNLSHNRMDDDAAKVLANTPALSQLSSLDLGYNTFSASGKRRLRQSEHLKDCRITLS